MKQKTANTLGLLCSSFILAVAVSVTIAPAGRMQAPAGVVADDESLGEFIEKQVAEAERDRVKPVVLVKPQTYEEYQMALAIYGTDEERKAAEHYLRGQQ